MSPCVSFLRRSRKDQNRYYASLFESKFWFFNEECHANTVPQIDHFSRAISYFSCDCNWSSGNAFFSAPPYFCIVMSFTCIHCWLSPTHPSLTPDLELLMTWRSSDSTGAREGELRLRCLLYEGSCMAACIPGISWALQVIAFHPPLLCQTIPLQPLATG